MSDSTSLAGRLFAFQSAAAVKNAANTATTDLRRRLGVSAVNIIADVSNDLCVPATIPATSSWSSPILPAGGMQHVSFAAKMTQGGSCVVNRYGDVAGNLLVASSTTAVVANATFQNDVASTVLFQAFNVTVTNTSASVATMSSFVGLLSK